MPALFMSLKCDYYCYKKTRKNNSFKKYKPEDIRLVLFDMDGVLTDTLSSWKFVHDYFGTCNDKSVDDYLRGEIDDAEFIRRDVSLWLKKDKNLTRDKLVSILRDIPLMKGAKDVMFFLKKHNVKTGIVSAGLDVLAERVANILGVDFVFANGILFDEKGFISGEGLVGVRLMYKDEVVRRLASRLGVSLGSIVSVGNSCFDIPMFECSGLGVAFNSEDDCVREAADLCVDGKDLGLIIPFISKYIK